MLGGHNIGKIIIGCDHGGFELKIKLKKFLESGGKEIVDFGCHSPDPVDYPDIAFLVADAVATTDNNVGIMIDGVGIASAMVANKVPGIRAALCWDIFTANNAREHNNANVLVLGGRVIGDALAIEIVKKFLETDFAGGRHGRRVNKIMAIEARYLKR
ncbi:MAG: ribose 5-phosphate isomerase B [Candidatus Thermoplasmatota archaeon]|nr:ribose 5-phosphate isomerase B [Candidatus Thermoplasmatota archaeon]